jgi:hypothetical protein
MVTVKISSEGLLGLIDEGKYAFFKGTPVLLEGNC